jgi:hypothetical protein
MTTHLFFVNTTAKNRRASVKSNSSDILNIEEEKLKEFKQTKSQLVGLFKAKCCDVSYKTEPDECDIIRKLLLP